MYYLSEEDCTYLDKLLVPITTVIGKRDTAPLYAMLAIVFLKLLIRLFKVKPVLWKSR